MRRRFADLHDRPGYPDKSSWGLYGDDDELGTLNDVTAEHVVDAARLVTTGRVHSLNWNVLLPDPAYFDRGGFKQTIIDDGYGLDDRYDGFWPQRSSQWDALSHMRNPRLPGDGQFYNGRTTSDVTPPNARNSIDNMARAGIAGRFVLADVERWRATIGRPLDNQGGEPITVEDLEGTLDAAGVSLGLGDFLLVRVGWIAWYESLTHDERVATLEPESRWRAAGLESSESMVTWLWDSGVAAVCADQPSVEQVPFDPAVYSLHTDLIPMLGMPFGELWYLDELARDCAASSRYTGLLVSAPINLPGGTGSPANALAIL